MLKIPIAIIVFASFIQAEECGNIKNILAQLESSNRSNITNNNGFLGKYQFGASLLADIGFVKKQNYINSRYVNRSNKTIWKNGLNHDKFLSNPNNWNLAGGREAFLNNIEVQEQALRLSCELNLNKLKSKGIAITSNNEKALILASHLGGVNSTVNYVKKGIDYKDSYGTKISKYFKAGLKNQQLQATGIINPIKIVNNNCAPQEATKYIGKKYVWGGTNPNVGADCSGFTQYLYKQNGINLPRTALSQSRVGATIPIGQWQKGDLLFFNTDKSRGIPITHVGMYLGGSKFIHAKGKKYGVTVSNIGEYANSFRFAKRVVETEALSSQSMITTNEIKIKQLNPYTAPTKTSIAFDSLVIYNGKYVHISELEKGVM